MKECGICVYKYSCGYGSIRRGKETDECAVPHLFEEKKDMVWSYRQQKLQPEVIVREEERLRIERARKSEVSV